MKRHNVHDQEIERLVIKIWKSSPFGSHDSVSLESRGLKNLGRITDWHHPL